MSFWVCRWASFEARICEARMGALPTAYRPIRFLRAYRRLLHSGTPLQLASPFEGYEKEILTSIYSEVLRLASSTTPVKQNSGCYK
jgi:hypothetical protein